MKNIDIFYLIGQLLKYKEYIDKYFLERGKINFFVNKVKIQLNRLEEKFEKENLDNEILSKLENL